MSGVGELGEPLHHRGLVAAAVFLVGPAGVEHTEVLESAIGPVDAEVEAVNDQRHTVFGEAIRRHFQSALARHRQAEIFVGCKLWILVRFPQFYDCLIVVVRTIEPHLHRLIVGFPSLIA